MDKVFCELVVNFGELLFALYLNWISLYFYFSRLLTVQEGVEEFLNDC